jgi:hypothetical protein
MARWEAHAGSPPWLCLAPSPWTVEVVLRLPEQCSQRSNLSFRLRRLAAVLLAAIPLPRGRSGAAVEFCTSRSACCRSVGWASRISSWQRAEPLGLNVVPTWMWSRSSKGRPTSPDSSETAGEVDQSHTRHKTRTFNAPMLMQLAHKLPILATIT